MEHQNKRILVSLRFWPRTISKGRGSSGSIWLSRSLRISSLRSILSRPRSRDGSGPRWWGIQEGQDLTLLVGLTRTLLASKRCKRWAQYLFGSWLRIALRSSSFGLFFLGNPPTFFFNGRYYHEEPTLFAILLNPPLLIWCQLPHLVP